MLRLMAGDELILVACEHSTVAFEYIEKEEVEDWPRRPAVVLLFNTVWQRAWQL